MMSLAIVGPEMAVSLVLFYLRVFTGWASTLVFHRFRVHQTTETALQQQCICYRLKMVM
jgi:hypothetical protein